jgi:two-component system, cell cycle sensor histidine kinase and response regulator CckA
MSDVLQAERGVYLRTAMIKSDITILIAEDDPLVRNMIRAIIQRQGYSFLVAADGSEAMTLSREYPDEIHMLLTDVKMPKMNGLDLAREIVKQRPGIRVLVISGEGSHEIRKANIALPFLRKPFTPKPLLAELQKVLNGPPAKAFKAS